MTEMLLVLLMNALRAGISAPYILFDSWFFSPKMAIQLHTIDLHSVSRVKNTPKICYLHEGEKKTVAQIYRNSKKRRGKSKYLLCVPVTLFFQKNKNAEEQILKARLIYVRDRGNQKKWIALVCTDPTLTEEKIIELYGKRWDIEVFLKMCKSLLKLTGEFRSLSYDAITAHTTIIMIRYQILALERQKMVDHRTLGALFFHCCDEVSDIRLEQAFTLLMGLIECALCCEEASFTQKQINAVLDAFIQSLPSSFKMCLRA